jgi:hypothetical protein
MAERIDGVFVELKADVDASGVIKSEQSITNSAKKIQNEFKKTDASLNSTGKALARQSKQSRKSASSMGGAGRSAGQASIQLQQFTGQVSGGVNPLIAFSQQAADLGIVMGAPLLGSIVGIGAAIGVVLLPELFKSTSAIEDLEKAIEALNSVAKKGDRGIFEFSESIKKLSKISNSIVLAELEVGVANASDAVALALGEIRDQFADEIGATAFLGLGESLASLVRITQKSIPAFSGSIIATKQLGEMFGATKENAFSLGQEIVNMFVAAEKAKTPKAIDELNIKLLEIAKSAKDSPEELKKLIVSLSTVFSNAKGAAEQLILFQEAIDLANGGDIDVGINNDLLFKTQGIAETLAIQLAMVRSEIDGGSNAARRLALAFELSDGASGVLPEHISVLITEIEKAEAAQISLSETEREEAAKTAKVKADLKAQESARGSNLERIRNEFKTESELLKEKIETELIMLEESLIKDGLMQSEYDELKKKKAEKLAAALIAISENSKKKEEEQEDKKWRDKLSKTSAALGDLSSLMNTESRKMFEIGKVAALSGAIIDGIAAVQGAFAVGNKLGGPPVGYAFAAAAGIGSAVQVQNIAKQKFGGGGGNSNSFSGGLPTTRTSDGGGSGGQDRNISIAGIDANSLISGGQLIDTLNQALGDGYTVNFAGG